jgi:hypothetical protein
MRIAAAAVLLLLAAAVASAAPTVTSIEPNVGFVYTSTRVVIHGTEFSESDFNCVETPGLCPSAVVFVVPINGELVEIPGTVQQVSPTHIELLVAPRPSGTVADVKVRVQRKGEVVVNHGFRWEATALSSNPADYVRYLIPVTGRSLPGAHGSLWSAEWVVHNGFAPFAMLWDECSPIVAPCPVFVMPEGTVRPAFAPRGDGGDGAFVYIPKAVAGRVAMSLRVRDLSMNAQSFGTEIPIATAADYTSQDRQAIQLIDIPTDPKYRVLLRIYGPNEAVKRVHVNVTDEAGTVSEAIDVELIGSDSETLEKFSLRPAYAQLDPLTPRIRAAGPRARISVAAYFDVLISPPIVYPIWAFATVTNNETQQVTTVTPTR